MSSISGSATAYNAYDIDQEFTTSERGSSTASNGNLKSNEVNYRKVIPNSPLNKALPNASEAGRIIKTVGGGVASNKLSTSFQDVGTELKRPFFHIISPSSGGLLGAIGRLDDELKNAGREGLISNKRPSTWTGRMVSPGEVGLYDYGGLPKLLLRPGRYPGFPLANWFACKWGTVELLSSTVIQYQGLTIIQVSNNQAAVVADPSNKVFIVKDGGFVSLSIEGGYRILGVVDQVNLTDVVVDQDGRQRILGYSQQVKFDVNLQGRSRSFVAATFLNIPANNCVILQRSNDMEILSAGQYVVTNPNVTIRGWYTFGESQLELQSQDLFTKDQVPLELKVYLRWILHEPLKLSLHGYESPFQALKDKAISVLTQIVGHLEYSSMIRQRTFSPGDDAHDGPDPSTSTFIDSIRTNAMDSLSAAAREYGIELKDFAVLDRRFKGDTAKAMDLMTTRSLQAQVDAANVDRENSNHVKQSEGALQVAQVEARKAQIEADALAYTKIAAAKAQAQVIFLNAEAQSKATLLAANADAESISIKAAADSAIKDSHARVAQLARVDVTRISAYGARTVFVGADSNTSSNVTAGYGLAMGGKEAGVGMAQ